MYALKNVGKSFRINKVGFVHNVLAHVEKKPFGTSTYLYVTQLALALVCYFYLLRMVIT